VEKEESSTRVHTWESKIKFASLFGSPADLRGDASTACSTETEKVLRGREVSRQAEVFVSSYEVLHIRGSLQGRELKVLLTKGPLT